MAIGHIFVKMVKNEKCTGHFDFFNKSLKDTKFPHLFHFGDFDRDMVILKTDILVLKLWLPEFEGSWSHVEAIKYE